MITLLILLNAYFVSFTDKPEKSAPQLSERAWEQREKWGIKTDAMDYPVSPMYLNKLKEAGASIYHYSRWFNGATVEMDATTAAQVAQLSFVKSVEMTRDDSEPRVFMPKRRSRQLERQSAQAEMENQLAAYTDDQLNLYNLLPLHQAGFEGDGILMAICDGGFYKANTLTCFRQKLELGHFDLTDDRDGFYGSTGVHGTECLSTISGSMTNYYGAATKAQYYLMRSEEEETESPKEMDNLVVALEKADSLGVNVFSVSLGYAMFDNDSWTLPKSALDGKSTRSSLAATIAARKGMLVCVAAGNEGTDEWRTISSPADADSILTVGAVNTNGQIGGFSSWGPSADDRVKPEVCAVGVAATLIYPSGSNGYITTSNGTSFATPLIAGLAATLWSALPKENAMQIRERIIRSADRLNNPDNHYGYGIPDAWKAYQMDRPQGIEEPTFDSFLNGRAEKVLRNGQLYILRNGTTYTVSGQKVE